jgi:hypothetical protein
MERSEAYFNEAERLDPRTVETLTQHTLPIDPRRFGSRNLIRFSILHRMM